MCLCLCVCVCVRQYLQKELTGWIHTLCCIWIHWMFGFETGLLVLSSRQMFSKWQFGCSMLYCWHGNWRQSRTTNNKTPCIRTCLDYAFNLSAFLFHLLVFVAVCFCFDWWYSVCVCVCARAHEKNHASEIHFVWA